MKKLKRVAAKLTDADRRRHQAIDDEIRTDPQVQRETQRIRAALQERRCEFSDVVMALKAAREARDLSLQDVCDRSGITRASLSLLENGHGNPTMTTLRRVADAIGVEIMVSVKG